MKTHLWPEFADYKTYFAKIRILEVKTYPYEDPDIERSTVHPWQDTSKYKKRYCIE